MSIRRNLVAAFGGALGLAALATAQNSSYEVPDRLDLNTALQFALEHNFDILQAKQRIEEQNGLIIEVRAQALPEVTARGQYVELDTGLSETFGLFPPNERNWSLSLDVRQTIYRGGGVRAALNVQKLIEDAALLELEAVINLALLQTKQGFYNALLARQRIQVQEDSVNLLEEQLQNARDRFEVGTVSNFEVLRAEVELANAQPELISARNDYRLAIEELRQVLGFFVAKPNELTKVPELVGELSYSPTSYSLEGALETALSSRPELLRLEKVVEAREEGVIIARAERLPDVSFIGSYQYNKASASSSFDDALHGWTAGVEVSVPVFDGRRAHGLIVQARSQARQSELDLQQTTLAVEVEVRRALSRLQEAGELAEASIKVVGQAEEALRLADSRYAAGEATQLDVLQARVSLTEAKLNQAQAFFQYNVAEAQVKQAIGAR